ncbi:TPA: hypothetical protein HA278_02105 [Candidatus Woesearchaeota archaeon]|nr:hypothetical protein [archaeon]HIJ10829.1 hypothetical protein [Candidatus Woesearchaeota archaeon]|tara:strand:- start:13 stop:576 length:564 start_codon:yes stop_codon:yes gene_type:complete
MVFGRIQYTLPALEQESRPFVDERLVNEGIIASFSTSITTNSETPLTRYFLSTRILLRTLLPNSAEHAKICNKLTRYFALSYRGYEVHDFGDVLIQRTGVGRPNRSDFERVLDITSKLTGRTYMFMHDPIDVTKNHFPFIQSALVFSHHPAVLARQDVPTLLRHYSSDLSRVVTQIGGAVLRSDKNK